MKIFRLFTLDFTSTHQWFCNLCSARYESYIDVEIQQRAVEYFALSKKGAALMDILAEMPKFPERQVWGFNLLLQYF